MFRHLSLIVISTAVYGLALGWWRSVEMALYVAAKLPVVFVGSTLVVSVFAWMAGLVVGARTLGGAVKAQAVDRTTGLSAWFVIFLVVALQALTLVRPMLSPIGAEREPEGKCFFLSHFFKSLEKGMN